LVQNKSFPYTLNGRILWEVFDNISY
jgi:hypothetical protein